MASWTKEEDACLAASVRTHDGDWRKIEEELQEITQHKNCNGRNRWSALRRIFMETQLNDAHNMNIAYTFMMNVAMSMANKRCFTSGVSVLARSNNVLPYYQNLEITSASNINGSGSGSMSQKSAPTIVDMYSKCSVCHGCAKNSTSTVICRQCPKRFCSVCFLKGVRNRYASTDVEWEWVCPSCIGACECVECGGSGLMATAPQLPLPPPSSSQLPLSSAPAEPMPLLPGAQPQTQVCESVCETCGCTLHMSMKHQICCNIVYVKLPLGNFRKLSVGIEYDREQQVAFTMLITCPACATQMLQPSDSEIVCPGCYDVLRLKYPTHTTDND